MAKEDFCFTYYDGDAARDKAHMDRLERGAYDDIISAQRKRGHLSLDDIKKVLSKDFEKCWPAMEWILLKDEQDKYFIEWVDKSVEKSKVHSKRQKEKIEKYWSEKTKNNTKSIPRNNHGIHLEEPLEDGNGNEDGYGNVLGKDKGVGKGEPKCDATLLLPKMLKVWKEKNSNYPEDVTLDFPALKQISAFICKQEGISYQPREPDVIRLVLSNWEIISEFVVAHKHFSSYNLQQVYKFRQNIVTEIKNEQSNPAAKKPGTRQKAGPGLEQKFNEFYRKGEPVARAG